MRRPASCHCCCCRRHDPAAAAAAASSHRPAAAGLAPGGMKPHTRCPGRSPRGSAACSGRAGGGGASSRRRDPSGRPAPAAAAAVPPPSGRSTEGRRPSRPRRPPRQRRRRQKRRSRAVFLLLLPPSWPLSEKAWPHQREGCPVQGCWPEGSPAGCQTRSSPSRTTEPPRARDWQYGLCHLDWPSSISPLPIPSERLPSRNCRSSRRRAQTSWRQQGMPFRALLAGKQGTRLMSSRCCSPQPSTLTMMLHCRCRCREGAQQRLARFAATRRPH